MKAKDTSPVNRYPVSLIGDRITCYAAFHGDLLKEKPEWGVTYAEVCREGICKYWGDAGFKVDIITVDRTDKRPHITFLPAKLTGTSYVMSRWWRWGWGIFTHTFHFETFMINWSKKHPGNIHMNLRIKCSRNYFMSVAAHEFGHILGIGDAYGANYRFFYEAPGTENYLMNHNGPVSPEEVSMVIRAQQTGKMQFFPVRFSAKRIISHFKKH